MSTMEKKKSSVRRDQCRLFSLNTYVFAVPSGGVNNYVVVQEFADSNHHFFPQEEYRVSRSELKGEKKNGQVPRHI